MSRRADAFGWFGVGAAVTLLAVAFSLTSAKAEPPPASITEAQRAWAVDCAKYQPVDDCYGRLVQMRGRGWL